MKMYELTKRYPNGKEFFLGTFNEEEAMNVYNKEKTKLIKKFGIRVANEIKIYIASVE